MTTLTKGRAKASSAATIDFAGRGRAKRMGAFMRIAPLAFAETVSRAETIANLSVVLGASPSEAEQQAARNQWVIGRVAARVPAGMLPKGKTSDEDRIAFANDRVLFRAAPAKPGTKERKLRAHQTGRRSPTEHKLIRAAEEAWSLVKAELGIGNARTLAEKTTRQAAARGSTKRGKAEPATLSQLATPPAPVSSDDYVNHMQTQIAALVAYDSKHARKRPTTHGAFAEQLQALRQTGNKAANDYQVRKAAAEKIAKA